MPYQPATPLFSPLPKLAALPAATTDPPASAAAPAPTGVGPEGIDLIKRFEGWARLRMDGMVEAYPDPGTVAAPWTIGWGAAVKDYVHGGRIGPGTVGRQAQCDARLADDLLR